MRKSYVIQWKSKVNGRAGKGTKLFSREEGEQLVDELNREYPDIDHQLAESELRKRESEGHHTASEQNHTPTLALSEV